MSNNLNCVFLHYKIMCAFLVTPIPVGGIKDKHVMVSCDKSPSYEEIKAIIKKYHF